MASLALGIVGAAVGFAVGGPVGAQIGFAVGSMVGNLLDPPKSEGPRLNDLKLQVSEYGRVIPMIFGTMRIAGNCIWQTDLVEHKQRSGGKGGPQVTTYTYSASFAIMLCEGPISGVVKVFADGRLIWPADESDFAFTLYTGSETQLPDPTMEAEIGAGLVPAHRGYAYVVFADLQLEEFGNRIPQLEFVVTTVEQATGPIIQVATATHVPQWDTAAGTGESAQAITEWATHWASTPALADPTGTAPTTVIFAGSSYQYRRIGTHVLADGTTHSLVASEDVVTGTGITYPALTGTDVIRISGIPNGTNYNEAYGVPNGLRIRGGSLTQDGKILYLFCCPNGNTNADTWYRIEDGAVVSSGTISPTLPKAELGYGNAGGGSQLGMVSMFENSGDIGWFYYGAAPLASGNKSVFIRHFVAGNFERDAAAGYGGPIQTGTDFGTVPFTIATQPSIYVTETGYAGTIGGTQTALWSRYADGGQVTLGDIVSSLSARTPLVPSEYDTSALTDVVPGFQIASQMEVRNALQPLRQAYFFDGVERDGKAVFVKRGGASVVTIPDDDLAARPDGSDAPALWRVVRRQEAELPQRVSVDFISGAFDYQLGTQYQERLVTNSKSITTVTLPISLTAATAKMIAGAHVWGAYQERETFTWWTARKYAKYDPTDVVTVQGVALRIDGKRETPDGVIEWTGVISRGDLYGSSNQPAAPGSVTNPGQTPPGARALTDLLLLDIPLVADTDEPNGHYAAMGPASVGRWTGAALYRSADGGTTYTEAASTAEAATIGSASTVLGDFYSGNVFDESNTVTVVLDDAGATLESATEMAVLNGSNLALLGEELLQYRNATLTAARTYTLTGLLRGRRGTEWATASHSIGDRFVVLPTLDVAAPFADLGSWRMYKPVTFGKTLAGATAQTFTNQGNKLKPYAPVQIGGGVNGSGDVTINWTRRTRTAGLWRDFVDVPLGESTESYVLEIRDASYALVARVVTGITAQTYTYTAAMQTTDFGATQQTIYCTVAQVGSFALGTRARGAIPGSGGSNSAPGTPVPPYGNPPGPAPGPTNPVNAALAWNGSDSPYYTVGYKIGDTFVMQFTTDSDPVGLGNIDLAQYGDPAYFRTAVLATDTGGINALGTRYGSTCSFIFGTGLGQVTLSASTTYYLIIKTTLPDGTPSSPLGSSANMIITF